MLVRVRSQSGDNITPAVIARVQQEGVCWVGGTTWNGEPAMRISISNWSTSAEDIAASAASIIRGGDCAESVTTPNSQLRVKAITWELGVA